MGADQHVNVPESELLEDLIALASSLAIGQDGDIDPGRGGERRNRVEMLPRQNFGWSHQRSLSATFDDGRRGEQRHHRLARTHVILPGPSACCGSCKVTWVLARSATM